VTLAPRQRRLALGMAALLAAAALAWPTVRDWHREREASRAFDVDLERIELEVLDKRRNTRGGFSERAAESLRFERIHALLRHHRHAEPPRFRKRMNLLLGVYDRTAQQAAASNRAAKVTLQVQLARVADVQDPARARLILQLLAEARHFATAFRAEVEASREFSRRAVAQSGLPREQRAEVWRVADQAYIDMQPSVAGAERLLPLLKRLEALVGFLDRHRGAYLVYPDGTLVFTDPDLNREWIVLQRKHKA
jgi:hypothetical protein